MADLSPITVSHVDHRGLRLAIDPPLVVVPRMVDGLIVAEDEALGIHAYAETLGELLSELVREIYAAWKMYACVHPFLLSPGAKRLRKSLLARMREVPPPSDSPLSPPATEIVAGLTEFRDALRSGEPIEGRFRVDDLRKDGDAR